jgi:hypothetical protein
MSEDNKEKEPKVPETLEEALMLISCHLGVFVFKCTAIVVAWLIIAQLLEQWLVK